MKLTYAYILLILSAISIFILGIATASNALAILKIKQGLQLSTQTYLCVDGYLYKSNDTTNISRPHKQVYIPYENSIASARARCEGQLVTIIEE